MNIAAPAIGEALSPEAFAEYLATQERKSFLRFITCGSVDDGKSTLIGRLLYETKLIFEDQLAAIERDSKKHGTTGDDIDLALLVDGLEAERQQGITIDVAYRFFTTDKRKFIVADTPGHEQYTRNMATGASTADVAVLLVDARYGIQVQTRRHAFLTSLLGIRHVVLAINKIDLVNFSEARFESIRREFLDFSKDLGFETQMAIPMSARYGDNVVEKSERTEWYDGPSLIQYLEGLEVTSDLAAKPFRLPVQWVNRPNLDFRGFSGTVASGVVRPGDPVVVAKSGREARVAKIVTMDGELDEARADEAVTIVLDREIDVSRGDVLVPPTHRPEVADQFAAHIVWMAEAALLPGRPYLFKVGGRTVSGSVTEIKHRIDVNSFEELAARELELNEIGVCNISLSDEIAFDAYGDNRQTGAFIVIDRLTNATVGAGMIDFALRRATNIHWQALDVSKKTRAELKGQKPSILWFTGLSGSGKSTIGNIVEKKLNAIGKHTYLLDGDNVRHGLNRDLGFTDADRVENIRRVAETARLFVDAGLIVIVTFISPFRSERRMARDLVDQGEFLEVFIDTPIEICRMRDPKGLYKKADSGQLKNFTGVDSPYEAPEMAELRVDTTSGAAEVHAEKVVDELRRRSIID